MTEEWRPIVGFEGYYDVFDLGRVRSLRFRSRSVDRPLPVPRLRTLALREGYPFVVLCRPGQRRRASVHHLVLEAFVGPCPPGHETGHLNHDRQDNRLTNLAWITRLENHGQSVRDGRKFPQPPADAGEKGRRSRWAGHTIKRARRAKKESAA